MKYIKNEEEFLKLFSKKIYDKVIKESTISSIRKISKNEYDNILRDLYKELSLYEYKVNKLDEKIYIYKTNNVARIIPILNVKDELVYYFACKMIEDEIAINRTPNTYGGWRIGNRIKLEEDSEIEYVYKSYNPQLWNENWKEFQNIVYNETENISDEDIILKLDIANFYDNINLNLLERKLLAGINNDKIEYINILMYFLKNWNIKNDKYNLKTVGLPQNEFGDQSRLLANFYIQDYDSEIKRICDSSDATYIRYADDQIIIIKDKSKINDIMYVISRELNKLGLNLNASKVKEFNKETIRIYYGIPVFKLLDEQKNNEAAKLFFSFYENKNIEFNYTSSLKRFLNIGFENFSLHYRSKLKAIVTQYQFVRESDDYYLRKIYTNLNDSEKKELIELVKVISKETTYNGFHYSAIRFLEKEGKDYDEITKRIKEIENI